MQGQSNLNCQQMEEELSAYYDLELSAEEAEAVELHLADCDACTTKLAEIDGLVSELKSLPAVEWRGDLSDAIEARILAQAAPVEATSSNVLSIDSAAKAADSAPSSASVVQFRPRYVLAAVASILALFFAYSQFGSSVPAAKVAQAPVTNSDSQPLLKDTSGQVEQNTVVTEVASKPEALGSSSLSVRPLPAVTSHLTPSALKVAAKPALPEVKPVKEVTTTGKMLANAELGERDHNNNNVNDSEEIVAVYDYDTVDSASDFGISTNEDGLYAIKL